MCDFKLLRSAGAFILVSAFGVLEAHAGPVTVAWDPNPEAEVIGYYLFIGTSPGDRSRAIDVGNVHTFTFAPDTANATYYVTVAAYAAGPVLGPTADEVAARGNVAPAVTNPGNQTRTRGTQTTLSLAVSDPDGDPITLAAIGLPTGLVFSSTSRAITGTPTAEGSFQTSVTASDPSGDLSTVTFLWTIEREDLQSPALAITGPTTAATYSTTSPFVTITGTASDDIGVSTVSWASSLNGSGVAAGTSNWSVIVPLKAGANVISLTARDEAGRSATRSLTISHQAIASTTPTAAANTVAPTATKTTRLRVLALTSSSRTPQTRGRAITFNASTSGGTASPEFQWRIHDGRRWTVLQTWGASPLLVWNPGSKGSYKIRVWARERGSVKDAPDSSNAQRTMPFRIR